MVEDLSALLVALPEEAAYEHYERAVLDQNVLGKQTASTRLWAWKKLRELYGFDPSLPVFRVLRTLWVTEGPQGRALLALLAALARDALLRASAIAVQVTKPGQPVTKDQFRDAIVRVRGDRFSKSTMDAILSHLVSSWTESGHLTGRKEKTRARPVVTPAVVAYALALGFLSGARGKLLFTTLWASVLDTPDPVLNDLAREASRRGWLVYRGVGDIIDIDFPQLLKPEEIALSYEQ
jgi:hypothetical protein